MNKIKIIKILKSGKLGLLMIQGKGGLNNIWVEDGTISMLSNNEYEEYGELEIDD